MDDKTKLLSILFQDGINILERAWRESEKTMWDQYKELTAKQDEAEAVEKAKGQQPTALSESSILNYQAQEVAVTIQVVRNSFVLSLYHFWERRLGEWMQDRKAAFEAKCAWLTANGLPLAKDALDDLRQLCNLLKHDNPAIASRRKDLLLNGEPKADEVVLTEAHMEQFFAAVRGSGYPRFKGYVSSVEWIAKQSGS